MGLMRCMSYRINYDKYHDASQWSGEEQRCGHVQGHWIELDLYLPLRYFHPTVRSQCTSMTNTLG